MHLTFSAPLTAADVETRTVAGQIVPFGVAGNTSAGPTVFEVGSITNLDAESVNLYLEHDMTRPVGRAQSFEVTPNGISARFRVANTTAGNDLLVEAAEGLRTGFSVGVYVDKELVKDGVYRIHSARLVEVSAVTMPAFRENSQITEVAASEPDADLDGNPETSSAAAEDETPMEENPMSETNAVDAAVVSDVAPVTAAAPIYTAPRVAPLSAGDYVYHSVKAAMGDMDSRDMVRATDDSTATNTGLTLPGHQNAFITNTFGSRPAVDACGGSRALPDSGMSFTIPRLTAAPTVADTNEGAAPSETGMTSDYITVDVNKFAGVNRVSFELMERSAPMFGDLLLAEMQKAYAKATDTAVIAALTAGGTAATATAGTIAGLQSFIATEGPAAYKGTGGDFASELVASSAWWSALLNANDSAGRPIFSALVPQNAGGNVSATNANGEVFGTRFWTDHNIATVGLIDESAFLIAPDSVGIWETPTTSLRVNVLTSGEIELSLHGYLAVSVLKAAGVRRYNLT